MNCDFCRREIDVVNGKWREIQSASGRKGEALAIDFRLHIHPPLREAIRNSYGSLNPTGDSQKEIEGVKAFERDRDKLREILTMVLERETLKAIQDVTRVSLP
jgi:hypothetical protein